MPWGIVYYQARDGSVPAEAFLDACPLKVEATILAVLEAVRQAPPPQFSGGGKWEAMHGTMGGYYEIRVTGPARAQYRLFCRLENGTPARARCTRLPGTADRRHHRDVQAIPLPRSQWAGLGCSSSPNAVRWFWLLCTAARHGSVERLPSDREPLSEPSGVTLLSDAPLAADSRDFFGSGVYAEAIASLIDNEVTDTPIMIAIAAPWGGGKTSVALQVRRRLDERTASRGQERPVRACWFDAWMHNDAPHLGAALAAVVARTANSNRPAWRRLLNPIPAAMLKPNERWRRRVVLAVFALIVAAVVVLIGPLREPLLSLKPIEATGAASAGSFAAYALLALLVARSVLGVADQAARFIDDPKSEAARGSMAEVKQQLASLINQGRRDGVFVIYVDDLERCTPERALEVCEVASQLLAHEGVVTVLIADMDAIAAAAEARFPRSAKTPGEMGSRFLEKIVQIHVALPPPHPEQMRQLMRGDPPDDTSPSTSTAEVFDRPSSKQAKSLTVAIAEKIAYGPWLHRVSRFLPPAIGSASFAAVEDPQYTPWLVAVVLVLAIPVGGAHAFLWHRARLARRQRRLIQTAMRKALASQPTQQEFERQVLESTDDKYKELALDELQTFRFDNTSQLRLVKEVLVRYPPALPRSAKRMLNQARLLTQIARDRRIFGGSPELTPRHLGEWIVLTAALAATRCTDRGCPETDGKILESITEAAKLKPLLDDLGLACPDPADDLLDLLCRPPTLSGVISRLAHFQPTLAEESHSTVPGPRDLDGDGPAELNDAAA